MTAKKFLSRLISAFLAAQPLSPFSYVTPLGAQSLLPQDRGIFEEEKPIAKQSVSEIEAQLGRARFIRYRQERWNEMRRRLETGEALIPMIEKPVPVAERRMLPAPPPPGPGLNVVLPYESGLSISGRKVIDFKLTSTIYAQPDSGKGRVNQADFELDQQLQVRVKGTVGRKVTVNVDFDDTRDDKRDISVVYKGDPDEVLQEAAFGDISISLPSTEFVGYSKSVFGVRAELLFRPRTGFAKMFPSTLWHRYTPKAVRLFMIGSRTKGITQTKRFTGNYILQRREINDISYPRRQFYQLAFATGPATDPITGAPTGKTEHRPIQVGSERIFIDDQNPSNNNIDESTRTVAVFEPSLTGPDGSTIINFSTFTGPSGENTGVFKLMVPGVDYTVDYTKGTIRFKRAINLSDIIVADYKPAGSNVPISQIARPNSTGNNTIREDPSIPDSLKPFDLLQGFKPLLIKPDESRFFATREMKNFYVLGDTKIQRDDGRGNFILKIINLGNPEPTQIDGFDATSSTGAQVKPVPKYPNDIDVDFENGIFTFVSSDAFRSPFVRPFTDDIYAFRETVPPSKNRYRLFAEYRFRKGNFSLDQINIVSQSEQVFLDGKRLTRDVDYFIDYDAGFVTFFRPDIIRDDSIVEITYDFAPFGGSGEETLVGMRSEWYVTDNFWLGQSVLLNFAPRSRSIPDLRSTSKSITVLEGDVNWKNVKFGNFPIQMTEFSAEIARSIKNPNTADKATLETFEGIRVEDTANLNKDSWQVAANPQKGNPGATPAGGPFQPGFAAAGAGARGITLSNEDFKITDINPAAVVETSDQLQALKVDYNLQDQNEAASIVQVFNRAGVDMFTNRRQFAELWIHGDDATPGNTADDARIQIRLGGIQELPDSSNSSTSLLKSEDKDLNGALSAGEDIGLTFLNPDASSTTVGAGNGRLDSQDLDGNGRLDGDDNLGNFNEEIGTVGRPLREAGNGTEHATVDWSGWRIFQVPLHIGTTGQNQWSTVKQVRITVWNPNAAAKAGTLRFGRVSIVGTRFDQAVVSTDAVQASAFAENNQDNPGYPSLVTNPVFQELYDLEDTEIKRREQALAIRYQRVAPTTGESTVTVKEAFTRALDFSEHETLKFFVHGDNSGNDFIFRVGNSGSYFEFRAPMTFSGWRLYELDILDKNRDGQLDRNLAKSFNAFWQRRVGAPSLRNITEITYGVIIPAQQLPSQDVARTFYFNEVHLTESVKITGTAYRAKTDFNWPNWGSWGAAWRDVDRNFQTLTSLGSGVDNKTGSGYLTLNRLSFLPLSSNISYSESITPQIQSINDPNILISVINEGKSINTSQNMNGNILLTQLPLLPSFIKGKLLNIDFSADHTLALRSDAQREDESLNYRYGTSYTLPWQPDILPGRFFTLKPLPTGVSYGFSQTNSILRLRNDNTDTRSVAESYSLRSQFQFIPQLMLSPGYTLSRSFEERNQLDLSSAVAPATLASLGSYNKSMNQGVTLGGSLRMTSWLSPGFNYSVNTAETYNINDLPFGTTTFRRGELKSITRSASGDINASIAPKDIFQYIPFVRNVNSMINSLSFNGGYSIADGDTYENLDGGFNSRDKLFIRDSTFDLTGMNPNAKRTSLTASDTNRLAGRWSPFEGFKFMKNRRWNPLKNLNASGSFTETKTSRDTTGTQSKSYARVWPDFVFSTSEIERPLFLSRWVTDTRANANYQERLTEVLGQTRTTGKNVGSDVTFTTFRLLQFSVGYTNSVTEDFNLQTQQLTSRTIQKGFNGQVITTLKWGNWRFTPRYDQSSSESEDGTGKKTSDLTTRNGSLQIFGDINVPRFFHLPFGKQLSLSNRLILTTSFRYGMVRDKVDETKSVDNADFNMNGDFEITPNIRAAFGGGYARTMHKVKKEENFQTYTLTSRVTIQF